MSGMAPKGLAVYLLLVMYVTGGKSVTTAETCSKWSVGSSASVEGGASALSVIDMDNDGDDDVVVCYERETKCEWHEYHSGSDSFGATPHEIDDDVWYGVGIWAGDVNADGLADVVVALSLESKIAVYYQQTDESFIKETIDLEAIGATAVQGADIDGDTDIDLCLTSTGADSIEWFAQESDGSWTKYLIDDTAQGARSVYIVDVDNDGDYDVVSAANYEVIAWHENTNADGNGETWTKHVIDFLALNARAVIAGDYDGDNDIDVAAVSYFDSSISMYENKGSESFVKTTITSDATGVTAIDALDIDGDGVYEIAAGWSSGNVVSVHQTSGSLGSTWIELSYTEVSGPLSIVAKMNFNGNTGYDILAASSDGIDRVRCGSQPTTSPVRTPTAKPTWIESTDMCRSPAIVTSLADGASSVRAADIDGDNDPDLIVGARGAHTISWFERDTLNDDAIVWTEEMIDAEADRVESIAVGDLDHDGDYDIAAALTTGGLIVFYENQGKHAGSARWVRREIGSHAGVHEVELIDMDGDENLDILVSATGDNTISYYRNQYYDGLESQDDLFPVDTIDIEVTISSVTLGARGVFAADLNNDGLMDVISASKTDDAISWYRNEGDSTSYEKIDIYTNAKNAREVKACDVDGDSSLDVVAASPTDQTVQVFFGDGTGNFNTRIVVTDQADGATDLICQDINNDGTDEIFSAWFDAGVVAMHTFDTSTQTFSTLILSGNQAGARSIDFAWLADGGFDVYVAAEDADSVTALGECLSPTPSPTTAAPTRSPEPTALRDAIQDGTACLSTLHAVVADIGGPVALAAFDVDDDGIENLVVGSEEIVAIYDCDESHEYSGYRLETCDQKLVDDGAGRITGVTAVDIDGDDAVDIIVSSSSQGKVSYYSCNYATPFVCSRHAIDTEATGAHSVQAIDVDGDGDYDVISTLQGDDTTVWYEQYKVATSSRPLWAKRTIDDEALGPRTAHAIDIDNDGLVDVVVGSKNDDTVAWHKQSRDDDLGVSTWTKTIITTSCVDVRAVLAVDVDGDDDLDIIAATPHTDEIHLYENLGSATFSSTARIIASNADGATALTAYTDPFNPSETLIFSAWYDAGIVAMHVPQSDGSGDYLTYEIGSGIEGARDVLVLSLPEGNAFDVIVAGRDADEVVSTDCLAPTAAPVLAPTPKPAASTPLFTSAPTGGICTTAHQGAVDWCHDSRDGLCVTSTGECDILGGVIYGTGEGGNPGCNYLADSGCYCCRHVLNTPTSEPTTLDGGSGDNSDHSSSSSSKKKKKASSDDDTATHPGMIFLYILLCIMFLIFLCFGCKHYYDSNYGSSGSYGGGSYGAGHLSRPKSEEEKTSMVWSQNVELTSKDDTHNIVTDDLDDIDFDGRRTQMNPMV